MIKNLILSACMLILSSVVVHETSGYPDFSGMSIVGPNVIPNVLAGFIAVIAVILILQEVYRCVRGRNDTPTYAQTELRKSREAMAALAANKAGVFRIVAILALMLLYTLLLTTLGFEICTTVFLVCAMLLSGVRKVKYLILVPLGTIAAVYICFVYALKVSIPMLFL